MALPIRGLLLDAGGVLYFPVGGRWNPRLDFEGLVARFSPAHDPARDPARFAAAVAAGNRYLDEANGTGSREDYHRAVLAALGIDDPPAGCWPTSTARSITRTSRSSSAARTTTPSPTCPKSRRNTATTWSRL
jgi:hypothetical protein